MAEGITRISVKGFKSLAEECSIEVRPLTILAGANSSGKSSIMQPLLMMKQTLEATYDPGPLLLDGPNVRFTSADQFLTKFDGKTTNKFSVGVELKNLISFEETFIRKLLSEIDVSDISYKNEYGNAILRPIMTNNDMSAAFLMARPSGWTRTYFKNELNAAINNKKPMLIVEQNRFFLELKLIIGDDEYATHLNRSFSNAILSLIHLPALRGNPERNYKKTSTGPRFPGTFEIYAASIIHNWQANRDLRLHALGADLEVLGLTWKVGARAIDDVSFEVMVGRLIHKKIDDSNDMVSIADVGFGLSQTLPVLVALLAAEPGQLVYIEQPEIHLHPKAQMAMAQILAEAANRGVRVVVETHSSMLLLGVQSLVAEGKLSPDKVKLHWFKRRPEDGVTEVSSADLDKAGAFGDWPEDFSSAEMDADIRYIHAAEARLEPN
jgi:predicted ATPase